MSAALYCGLLPLQWNESAIVQPIEDIGHIRLRRLPASLRRNGSAG